jgi:transposase-like protein
MGKDIARPERESTGLMWEDLERMVRARAQAFIQEILEEEVTEVLGRRKSERKAAVDPAPGYRNGYGKPRRLAMSSGTVTVRRPRVRGLEERFESRVLPLFARRTKEVGELIPELYLHGLAEGDFELALRGLLGEGAPLSKASIRRLRASWTEEFERWAKRSLADREVVYIWTDGIYVKAGLERDKAALLVVMGAMRDGTKEVLAVTPGYRESTESWSEVFRDLKARGLGTPQLLVADGNAAIWGGAREVWPETAEQRCWNHYVERRIMWNSASMWAISLARRRAAS